MPNLKLIKPEESYADEIKAFREEMIEHNSPFDGCSGLQDFEDIKTWITMCRQNEINTDPNSNWVEAEQFMLVQDGSRKILAMLQFRHRLNDFLAEYGGHIGYAVRPTERRKGYAKAMLALCLNECRNFGLTKVLLTCNPTNVGSHRTIEANGGKYERTTKDENGEEYARYWIVLEPLANYYNTHEEDARLTSKHGQVEFLTTMRYIKRYLTPDARVIDIGAGTGRYSIAIASMGYQVDAVELFQSNIDVFRAQISQNQNQIQNEFQQQNENQQQSIQHNMQKNINITQGNALNLSAFADNNFDITLLFGPLYHLYTVEDKQQAISEAMRVTKPGGVIFAAHLISDASLIQSGFSNKNFDLLDYFKARFN